MISSAGVLHLRALARKTVFPVHFALLAKGIERRLADWLSNTKTARTTQPRNIKGVPAPKSIALQPVKLGGSSHLLTAQLTCQFPEKPAGKAFAKHMRQSPAVITAHLPVTRTAIPDLGFFAIVPIAGQTFFDRNHATR